MLLNLSPKEKAAVLMIALGKDTASKIYKYLSDEEIEKLTISITSLDRFNNEDSEEVFTEFYEMCIAQRYIAEGGITYARDVLVTAMGESRADDILTKLSSTLQARPFDFVRRADAAQVLNFIQNEHPQLIAIVLSYLSTSQSAEIVSSLDDEIQADVIRRMAKIGTVSPELIRQAEIVLERKLSTVGSSDTIAVGGIDAIVNILNFVDRSTESRILAAIEREDRDLAYEIHSKMFVFEDIAKLQDGEMQKVLRDVDTDTLAVALKGANEKVSAKIFSNVSKRLQEMLKENMEFIGPVKVRDVEAAQQKIVNIIRSMEESNMIDISRGGREDELIV